MEYYALIKALHIIAVIAWMAGLLYLPRLFVYHTQATPESDSDILLRTMEKNLLRYIMNPAMIAVFILGGILAAQLGEPPLWLTIKILLVLFLAASHGAMAKWRKDFENGKNTHSTKFYRIINEVPTVLMIGIVLLVILKPFY